MKTLENQELIELINTARSSSPADVLLKNVSLVNVFSAEIYRTNVLLKDKFIAAVGEEYTDAEKVFEFGGKYLLPGLIDGHVHLESSMVSIPEYTKAVLPHGTTSVVADPHEIANVLGLRGVKYMLHSSRNVPLNVFLTAPSCVPATELETSGATLNHQEINEMLGWERVVALGELMNYPGVIYGVEEVMNKLLAARQRDKPVDGHAPGLSGKQLNAYIAAGIYSDHECTTRQEAAEKLRLGMWIMLREGSAAKNLAALLPLVNNANFRRCLFVTDDRHPRDLLQEGHIDQILRKAVSLGLDPIRAVQMATINTAQRFGLKALGAVAPGYIADLVIVNNLKDFEVETVFKDGRPVVEDGQLSVKIAPYQDPAVLNTVNTAPLSLQSFKIKLEGEQAKIIELVPDQIVTKKTVTRAKSQGGLVVSDWENDILKLAVIERHQATGNIGLGLVKGFGLNRGALASSVGHDSHNIIVVGTDDRDMLVAVEKIAALGGGYAVVCGGRVLASLPLPIAGLMSDRSVQEVQEGLQQLHQAGEDLGVKPESPFITLSFLALPVIPELKLTDKGLVDVIQFKIVPLWGE